MPESIEQPKPITINKDTDHFFLAISKQSEHSFLMLGTYENTKVNHLLCRVGKIPSDNELGCWNIKDLFFSSVPSGLVDEGISRERRHGRLITYHSCDISYEQYLEFIQTLEAMQTADNLFKCYKVMEEQGSTVTLEKTSNIRSPLKQYSVDLNTSIHEFSINNTCSHN